MTRRALIVDDDPATCEVMRGVLDSAGMDVLVLARGAEAIQHINNRKFALLIFGVRMQAPDGKELAQLARESDINHMTPVVLVTDETTEDASHTGTTFFLQRPVDRAHLVTLLRAAQGAVEHEKRRFRRVALRSKVRLAFEKQEWEGETVDVSLNGMLVRGPGRIAAGTTVNVSLFLSGESKPVVGVGRITRVQDQNLMGIYLSRLTMEESGRLQSFLLPMILREEPEAKVIR